MTTLAILCSDLHFSHVAPSFRSSEKSWYECMKRGIDELKTLADRLQVPIICAGDVLDRWNSVSELTNFLIDNLPTIFSVYGQHDAPFHRGEDLNRSAYGTLVRKGTLIDLGTEPQRINSFFVHPFPWNTEITPLKEKEKESDIHLAVVHRYIWDSRKNSYPGAEEQKKTEGYLSCLRGYDAAVFGDNHRGFVAKIGNCNVINCGTFFRRKSDEREYQPQIGLLQSDGTIIRHFLDTSKDVYFDSPIKDNDSEFDATRLLKELEELGTDSLDFREAVTRYLDINPVEVQTRDFILKAISHDH